VSPAAALSGAGSSFTYGSRSPGALGRAAAVARGMFWRVACRGGAGAPGQAAVF